MFYDRFKSLCDAKGISCNRAAIEIGLSNATPTTWKKRGLTPKGDTLAKIAEYFDVSVGYLLGTDAKKAPTASGERKPDIEGAKIALFGGDGEVTDEMWEEAIFAAQLIKDRHKRKKE